MSWHWCGRSISRSQARITLCCALPVPLTQSLCCYPAAHTSGCPWLGRALMTCTAAQGAKYLLPHSCRRITLPLDGQGADAEIKLEHLMKDDSVYFYSELPRVNPRFKVTCIPSAHSVVTSSTLCPFLLISWHCHM